MTFHPAVLWPLAAMAGLAAFIIYVLFFPKPKPKVETYDITPKADEKATFAIKGFNTQLSKQWPDWNTPQPVFKPPYSCVTGGVKLWVYNTSRMTHTVDHPTLGQVKIPGNTTSKRYALYTSFPGVVMLPKQDMNFDLELYPVSGEYFVKDLISPDHIYDTNFDSPYSTGVGRNLAHKGVFFSYHNPPKHSEVEEAVALMEKRYRDLLEAVGTTLTGEKKRGVKSTKEQIQVEAERRVNYRLFITPEHHAAAEWFKITTPWHPVLAGQ